jgi:hypothetical protein
MKTISLEQLALVTGGMQWGHFPRSSNVEDARGMSPGQASRAWPGGGGGGGGAADRSPGSLADQAGINSMR